MTTPRVLVPLATGFEEIEAVTVIDILRRAEVTVTVAGVDERRVRASRGVTVEADALLDEVIAEEFDLIVLPGGAAGAKRLREDERVQDLIRRQSGAGRALGAICAAPSALASAGVLTGHRATSFPGFLEPGQAELSDDPVVEDRGITTSRGPGTAMPFALALVEQLRGAEIRREVESRLLIPG